MQLRLYNKLLTCILVLCSPLLPGVTFSQAATHSIYLAWTYNALPEENIQFFSLYMDESIVCQSNAPAERAMDCKFEAPNGTHNFYLSARTDEGESPLSPPFPFTLNETVKSYSISYKIDGEGSLAGNPLQTIIHGSDGTSIEAIPAPNHYFVQWSDGSTSNPRIDSNVTTSLTLTAMFSDFYKLDISLAGNGAGTVTSTLVDSDNCTSDCSINVKQDSIVTLTPVANEGYKFTGWSGDQCTGTEPCTIRVEQHCNIAATFEKKFPWNLFMPILLR
jgi:hypothetical protein